MRPSSCTSSWHCPRRHLARFTVQFLSLCRQDRVLASCRRRLHNAPEQGIVLTNFFVHTTILPNQLWCTAIWLPSKQTKKWGADEADLKVHLRLQEDPTLTLTSPRLATSAPAAGLLVWKRRVFDFLSSGKFEKVGVYWAYWQHHGQPSSSTLSPHTSRMRECTANSLPSRSSGALASRESFFEKRVSASAPPMW